MPFLLIQPSPRWQLLPPNDVFDTAAYIPAYKADNTPGASGGIPEYGQDGPAATASIGDSVYFSSGDWHECAGSKRDFFLSKKECFVSGVLFGTLAWNRPFGRDDICSA